MAADATLTESVEVGVPAQRLWDAVVDWPSQSRWMLLTRVRGTAQDGHGLGGGIEAFTGVGRVGVLDTMTITEWDPPRRCAVVHTGRVVRGTAVFDVVPCGAGRSRLVWTENLEIPFRAVGRLGWRLGRPVARAGVVYSLNRLRRSLECGR